MTQEQLNKTFEKTGRAEIDEIIIDAITELSMDMGKKLAASEFEYFAKRLGQTIDKRYKNWRIIDFMNCLDNGKIGTYASKVAMPAFSVATVEMWMARHSETVQSAIIEQQKAEAAKMRGISATALSDNRNPVMAEAIMWRLNAIASIAERTGKKGISSPEYIRQKEAINAVPFCKIVDAIKQGTAATLLNGII